jgi:hypothetical protein
MRVTRVPTVLAGISQSNEEFARRKGLDARDYLIALRRARTQGPVYRAPSVSRAAFLTAPTCRAAIMTADAVGEWTTLSVGEGERVANGPTTIRRFRDNQVSAFSGDAVFDIYRVPRLQSE